MQNAKRTSRYLEESVSRVMRPRNEGLICQFSSYCAIFHAGGFRFQKVHRCFAPHPSVTTYIASGERKIIATAKLLAISRMACANGAFMLSLFLTTCAGHANFLGISRTKCVIALAPRTFAVQNSIMIRSNNLLDTQFCFLFCNPRRLSWNDKREFACYFSHLEMHFCFIFLMAPWPFPLYNGHWKQRLRPWKVHHYLMSRLRFVLQHICRNYSI